MDIQQKIKELALHAFEIEKEIESNKKELNQTKLTIRRLIRHNEKADEILNGAQLLIVEK